MIREIEQNRAYTREDAAFVLCLLGIGFFFWDWIDFFRPGAGAALFIVVLCLVCGIYLVQKGFRQTRRSLLCLLPLLLCVSVFILYDSFLEKQMCLFLAAILFIWWIGVTTGNTMGNRISGYAAIDFIHLFFSKGFGNIPCLPAMVAFGVRKRKNGKRAAAALAGILIMVPVLCLVIALLTRADAAFEFLIKQLQEEVFSDLWIHVWYFILGIPVALYLCGLVRGCMMKCPPALQQADVDRSLRAFAKVPQSTVYTALALLNLVYLIFFCSQAAYLFSAFQQILPEGTTYAEYARRGFFELSAVSAINLMVAGLALFLIRYPRKKILKGEIMILSVFTILLTVTGLSKMVLYIENYGLTRLRVYTSVFMLLLFAVLLILLLRQIRPFNSGRAILWAALICFFGLCFVNVDGQIAKYNMKEYEKGNLPLMDQTTLMSLSDGATPYLYQAWHAARTAEDRESLYQAILWRSGDDNTFRTFNLQMYKGKTIRENLRAHLTEEQETAKRDDPSALPGCNFYTK